MAAGDGRGARGAVQIERDAVPLPAGGDAGGVEADLDALAFEDRADRL